MKHGLLLINLGTPDAPTVPAVRHYLRDFLSDPRVINLPTPLRYLLLYGIILPFRPRQSAKAYQQIWTKEGSPLLQNSLALKNKVQNRLGQGWVVALGMRYSQPSISKALEQLTDCDSLTILPLYPQYSSAATGSSIEKALSEIKPYSVYPNLKIIRDFYNHPAFIQAQANLVQRYLTEHDFILFSYHGVPENQLLSGPCKVLCKKSCAKKSPAFEGCYRAQCHQTTALLADYLQLSPNQYMTTFQSRLGRTKWIEPYTDEVLKTLRDKGIQNLAVTCPSFVADCLETLEEIGIRLNAKWQSLGGKKLTLIPSLNDSNQWVKAIIQIIKPTHHPDD